MSNLSQEEIVKKNKRRAIKAKKRINALSWFCVAVINLVVLFALFIVIRCLWIGVETTIDGYANMSIADTIFACILTSIIYYNAGSLIIKRMSKKGKK